jgi:hypothetical protein
MFTILVLAALGQTGQVDVNAKWVEKKVELIAKAKRAAAELRASDAWKPTIVISKNGEIKFKSSPGDVTAGIEGPHGESAAEPNTKLPSSRLGRYVLWIVSNKKVEQSVTLQATNPKSPKDPVTDTGSELSFTYEVQ